MENLLQILLFALIVLFVTIFIGLTIFFGCLKIQYNKSSYAQNKDDSFFSILKSKGIYGEFLTYLKLEQFPFEKKLFHNLYIPKEKRPNQTTEIDLVMLCEFGIFVFESKNYSGWIYGKESDNMWTQSFAKNRRFQFYNPTKQNKTHINELRHYLNADISVFHSIIVFSERCKLQKISVPSKDVLVLKRNHLVNSIQKLTQGKKALTASEIQQYSEKLKESINADPATKRKHIEDIKKRYQKT